MNQRSSMPGTRPVGGSNSGDSRSSSTAYSSPMIWSLLRKW